MAEAASAAGAVAGAEVSVAGEPSPAACKRSPTARSITLSPCSSSRWRRAASIRACCSPHCRHRSSSAGSWLRASAGPSTAGTGARSWRWERSRAARLAWPSRSAIALPSCLPPRSSSVSPLPPPSMMRPSPRSCGSRRAMAAAPSPSSPSSPALPRRCSGPSPIGSKAAMAGRRHGSSMPWSTASSPRPPMPFCSPHPQARPVRPRERRRNIVRRSSSRP